MQGRDPNKGIHFSGAKLGGVGMPKKGQSAPAGNSPKTGAKPQMKPGIGTSGAGSAALASQVKASPAPFRNPQGVLKPTGAQFAQGAGNGVSRNPGGVQSSKPPKRPPIAPTGGYRPKKNTAPVGKSAFYGE